MPFDPIILPAEKDLLPDDLIHADVTLGREALVEPSFCNLYPLLN